MSISTKTGDAGETGLIGGKRVSKGDLRIEAYGTIDELGSVLGFARSVCANEKIREATKTIQKELFTVSAAVTGAPSGLTKEMVDSLTTQVNEIESLEGILSDWALPGENTVAAAYDVARTVCRRAERVIVRLLNEGEKVDPLVLAYVNRLSDLLWLFGRYVEKEAGVDSRLRDGDEGGAELVARLVRMSAGPIEPPDERFAERARARQRELTKPPGSLGDLETIAVRLASIQRRDRPTSFGRRVVVFAANHGVVAEGVSPYPAEVTAQMVSNFAAGGAAINALARAAQADVVVVDVGVSPGTRNFAREPAMTEDEMQGALERGREEARRARVEGVALLGLGEMGIGNTTAASAVTAALTGLPPSRVTGSGTGLDEAGRRRKVEVIERALALHDLPPREPLEVLRSVGGLEIAALAGLSLEAASQRLAIVVDGFIASAAFALAAKLEPLLKDYAFFSHLSTEPGHRALLDFLGVEPLLDLGLRLGEGTGAALAMPVLGSAVAAHNEMATFADAGVSGRT